MDRANAKLTRNWGKVAQDDRLIAADKEWMRRDKNKLRQAGAIPPRKP
jgi:hypothetical protein